MNLNIGRIISMWCANEAKANESNESLETFPVDSKRLMRIIGLTDQTGAITPIGRRVCQLSELDPRLGRIVIEAESQGCAGNMPFILATLVIGIGAIFRKPRDRYHKTGCQMFYNFWSDLISVKKALVETEKNKFSEWYDENLVVYNRAKEARFLAGKIRQYLTGAGIEMSSLPEGEETDRAVARAIASGFLYNLTLEQHVICKPLFRGELTNLKFHPESVFQLMSSNDPKWVVAADIYKTSHKFARALTRVELDWFCDLFPELFALTDPKVISVDPKKAKDGALVEYQVLMAEEEDYAGTVRRMVSLDDAKKFYRSWMDKVKVENLRLLIFHQPDHLQIISNDGVRCLRQHAQDVAIKVGTEYYCRMTRGGSFASPQFQRFIELE